jgi:hypothetical protein
MVPEVTDVYMQLVQERSKCEAISMYRASLYVCEDHETFSTGEIILLSHLILFDIKINNIQTS